MKLPVRQLARAALAIGLIVLGVGAWQWWAAQRAFTRMRAATCTVVSKTIDWRSHMNSPRRRFTAGRLILRGEAHLVLAHTVAGQTHTFSEDFVDDWAVYEPLGFAEGQSVPCRYAPEAPDRGTVRTQFDDSSSVDLMLLGAALLLIGVAGPKIATASGR